MELPTKEAETVVCTETVVEIEKKNLVSKLNEIVSAVDHVEKEGFNEFSKYNYVKAASLARLVRTELASRNVLMLTTVLKVTRGTYPAREGNMNLIDLELGYAFLDGDSNERLPAEGWLMALGEGADKGDKSSYKAMTGAMKYALRNSFLVPDEAGDPEADETTDKEAAKLAAQAVAAAKTAQDRAKSPSGAVGRAQVADPHSRAIFYRTADLEGATVFYVYGFLNTIRAEMVERCFAYPSVNPEHKGHYIVASDFWTEFQNLCAERQISLVDSATAKAEPETATPPQVAPSLAVSGPKIEAVKELKTKKNQPYWKVVWNGLTASCFDKDVAQYLKLGLPAQLLTTTQGDYTNIIGAVFIGNLKFEADGKTPIKGLDDHGTVKP